MRARACVCVCVSLLREVKYFTARARPGEAGCRWRESIILDLQGRWVFFGAKWCGGGEYRFEKERRRSAQPARYGHLVLNPAPACAAFAVVRNGGGGGGRKKTLYRVCVCVCVSVSAALLGTHLHC
jgi:hypothetical protein